MRGALSPCPGCQRHVRAHEPSCPFCRRPGLTLGSVATAVGAAALLMACNRTTAEAYGGPPPNVMPVVESDAGPPPADAARPDAGPAPLKGDPLGPVPAYGAPPPLPPPPR